MVGICVRTAKKASASSPSTGICCRSWSGWRGTGTPCSTKKRLPVKNEGGNAWASLHSTRFPPAATAMDADLEAAWEARWQGWWRRHALRAASDGGLFPRCRLPPFSRCRGNLVGRRSQRWHAGGVRFPRVQPTRSPTAADRGGGAATRGARECVRSSCRSSTRISAGQEPPAHAGGLASRWPAPEAARRDSRSIQTSFDATLRPLTNRSYIDEETMQRILAPSG